MHGLAGSTPLPRGPPIPPQIAAGGIRGRGVTNLLEDGGAPGRCQPVDAMEREPRRHSRYTPEKCYVCMSGTCGWDPGLFSHPRR